MKRMLLAIVSVTVLLCCSAQQRAEYVPFWKALFGGVEAGANAALPGSGSVLALMFNEILKWMSENPEESIPAAAGAAALATHGTVGIPGTDRYNKKKEKRAKRKEQKRAQKAADKATRDKLDLLKKDSK